MAELSITCPICGGSLTALEEEELVHTFKEHAHHHHGKEMPGEEAKKKVKNMMAQSQGK